MALLLFGCLLAVPLASGTAGRAADRPDFSGVWRLNLQESVLQVGDKIESGTFTIDHKEPAFSFHRVFVVGGKSDETSYRLTTDGKESVAEAPGRTTRSRLFWDGETLVLDETITLKDGRRATNVVRYSLRDEGRTLIAEERFRGPIVKHDNLWVADKAS